MGQKGIIYPNDKRIEMDGGLNTKFERSIISDNESPDCANVIYSNGAVETREGSTQVTVSGLGSYVYDGLYTREDNTGAETMVAFANGSMYDFQTNTFVTIPSAQSIWTGGVNIDTAQYENYMFIGNGYVLPYKYNGAFTRHGVYPAGSAATAGSGAAGTLTGDYSWKVTYVNSALVESDVNTASDTLSLASGIATITCIPVAPQSYGVNARKLYRTVTSGTTYLLVDTISDNTTTTYSDNTPDADLGAEAPTDQGVPPNYSVVIYYRDRLFMNDLSNPNFIWYTELANPYVVKATNFIRIGDNTTDTVTALGVVQNTLVVFGEETINFIYMPDTTPSNWGVVAGEKQFGCKSPHGIVNLQGRLIFPAVQNGKFVGFAALTGAGIEPSSTFLTVLNAGSDRISDRIEPDMFAIQEAYLGNITGKVYKNKAYFNVTYGTGNTINNRIYVYDPSISNLSRAQQFTWTPFTGLNPKMMTILDGKLYYASSSSNSGQTYQILDGSYNDSGAAIDSYVWTKEFGGRNQDRHYHKDFKDLYLLVDTPGAYPMNVTVRTDSDSGGGDTTAISLDPGGALWGTAEWTVDLWGGGNEQDEKILRLTQTGKRIQFKVSNQNTADQRFKLHALGFKYNRKGSR